MGWPSGFTGCIALNWRLINRIGLGPGCRLEHKLKRFNIPRRIWISLSGSEDLLYPTWSEVRNDVVIAGLIRVSNAGLRGGVHVVQKLHGRTKIVVHRACSYEKRRITVG